MSSAATSTSALRRALLLAAASAAGCAVLFGGAAGAGATSLAACTTSVSVPTATPSTAPAGTTIVYSATVTAGAGCANGAPAGTVSFYSNYLVNGQLQRFPIGSPVTLPSSGTATLGDNSLPAGTFTITATFVSADTSLFTNSGSPSGTQVVIESTAQHTTQMTFTENPTSLVVGQSVTFHVHITPVDMNGNPLGTVATGSVEFSAGPTAAPSAQSHFWSQELDGTGSITFSYNGFVAGDYIVIASYTGDPVDQGISGQLPLTVVPSPIAIATSTSIGASPSSITFGNATTLTAHVLETATQTPPPPGGIVQFFAGPDSTNVQLEGSGTLDANGTAQLSGVAGLPVGNDVVRAQYLGDTGANILGSTGDSSVSVSAPPPGATGTVASPTETTYVGDTEAAYGSTANLTGHLAMGNGSPLSGEPLTLTLGGQSCTTAPTTGTGNASCAVVVAQPPGSYTATATFSGDTNWAASSGSGPFTVDRGTTSLVYDGAVTAAYGANAVLSATLTDAGAHPIAGESVHLVMDGLSCDAVTGTDGRASCTVVVLRPPTTYPVSASFAGDSTYSGSGASSTFTVTSVPTVTTYTGATSGVMGTQATLSAQVAGGVDGEPVTFAVGAEHCTGTLVGGSASCTVTLSDTPGSGYTVTAGYAGDAAHLGSSDAKPFTVVAPVSTTKAGAVAPVLAGAAATLTATVAPAAATGTVTFTSGGATLCTAVLSGGNASCAASFAAPGSYAVTASYSGDRIFPPSSGGTSVLVYALAPGGGAFVVGDRSASGTVTFWGAQWWKLNVLGGGPAPSSFKGFAASVPAAACGATWSTDPGNSSPPPAGPLPAYMAVVVTSKATQSGSQIAGNVVSIVIVKTSAGYAGDPGHAGTGAVVATLCGGGGGGGG
ncbi:MAG: Ig-like domain repeat protein [Acidobacteriota bacterium]|nr:Ig-like domain repeat protein [Acidobacteriota bacterium]